MERKAEHGPGPEGIYSYNNKAKTKQRSLRGLPRCCSRETENQRDRESKKERARERERQKQRDKESETETEKKTQRKSKRNK